MREVYGVCHQCGGPLLNGHKCNPASLLKSKDIKSQAAEMREALGIKPTDRDWEEDFTHENGNYQMNCLICEKSFIGHKRRIVCKKCTKENISVNISLICRLRDRLSFADHLDVCAMMSGMGKDCDCDLDSLLFELGELIILSEKTDE